MTSSLQIVMSGCDQPCDLVQMELLRLGTQFIVAPTEAVEVLVEQQFSRKASLAKNLRRLVTCFSVHCGTHLLCQHAYTTVQPGLSCGATIAAAPCELIFCSLFARHACLYIHCHCTRHVRRSWHGLVKATMWGLVLQFASPDPGGIGSGLRVFLLPVLTSSAAHSGTLVVFLLLLSS